MLYLESLYTRPDRGSAEGFPFDLPVVRALDTLTFRKPVTFLVGDNGTGKSTLLEAIAAGIDAAAAGSAEVARDPTLATARRLAGGLRFVRKRHPRTRLFFRAEDAFGFTKRVTGEIGDLEALDRHYDETLPDGYGKQLARGVARGQRRAYVSRYGEDPDAASHGESFLRLLQERLHPNGLYLLDEPETPLSPTRVLALMSLIAELAEAHCQFIIATHSPILMALPMAEILLLSDGAIRPVAWDEVEHVSVTRAFLNNPESFLRRLAAEDE